MSDPEQVQGAPYWQTRPDDDKEMDWPYTETDWVEGYKESVQHPHRQVILAALGHVQFESLFEIGCNCGPNLHVIHEKYPDARLKGIDINPRAVEVAQSFVVKPGIEVEIGNLTQIPAEDQSFDVVLSDAVLLYVDPTQIGAVMDEMARVAKKAILLVERFSESEVGEVTGHVWGRDYAKLLRDRGFSVMTTDILPEMWPTSPNWQKYGRVFLAMK